MKILLLTDRMETGGVETHIAQLALGLRNFGIEAAVLSGGGALADALEKQGIRQYRLPLPTHNPLRLLGIRRYIGRLLSREGFRVLHAHARIPALLLRGMERRGVAVVVSAHAMFRSNWLLSRICYWGRYTVAVSEDLRESVCQRYRLQPERVCVIRNGIDCTRFTPKRKNKQRHAPCILFASRLDGDCSLGAELLCRLAPALASRFPGLKIRIAGGGTRYRQILRLAKEANDAVGDTVTEVCGWVSDMPRLLEACDIFVGVSRAALEACAGGCAVVLCGDEGYLGILDARTFQNAMLTNFCARGFEKADERQLFRDLLTLLENPDKIEQCAAFCREIAKKYFDAQEMCRKTAKVYRRALSVTTCRAVVLAGYYGCGNLGDDAILFGILEEMKIQSPDTAITVLSGHPLRDRRRFGVRCIDRMNPIGVFFALLRADALLFGGGSLLQNITGKKSLHYYLGLLSLAKRLHCRVLFYAAGIGPLVGERTKRHVAATLKLCDRIGLRDADSVSDLRRIGLDADMLQVGADAAFLMPLPQASRSLFLLHRLGIPRGKGYLCLTLHGGTAAQGLIGRLLSAVYAVCQKRDFYPLVVVFDSRTDGRVSRTACAQLGGDCLVPDSPTDAMAVLSSAKLVVSMRLHAVILATAVGTPAIGIPADSRDNKIAAFCKSCGQICIPGHALQANGLAEQMENLLDTEFLRSEILHSAAEQRKKAQKDLANILSILYNKE